MPILRKHTQPSRARVFRDGIWSEGERTVIGETPVAIVVNGSAEAVMMATAADLQDFVIGFALTERLVESLAQVKDLDFAETSLGIEARLWLHEDATRAHVARRRRRAGLVGCGLCGVESLEDAMRPLPRLHSDLRLSASDIVSAMGTLAGRQPMNRETRAAHAAALYRPDEGVGPVREDIGRHSALDKLAGALTREGKNASGGAILMTSRVSIELIQKAAYLGAPVLAAISAPSALAIESAEAAHMTLCGVVRDNGLEVFTHPERVV